MKYLTPFLFVLFTTFQIGGQVKMAPNSGLSFPTRLDSDSAIESRFKELTSDLTLTEKFYPVGWSRSGKFAYLVEPADEACGCFMATFVIQDLKTDRILWNDKYLGAEGTGESPEEQKIFWQAKGALFARKLKEHGIQPSKEFSLLSFPIRYQTDEFIPLLEIKRLENSADDYPHNVSQIIVKMNSKQKGKKRLFQKTFDETEMIKGVLDADLFGYFLSPFEPRAALIVIEVKGGYEGPPNITRTRVIGTSLVSGFKK